MFGISPTIWFIVQIALAAGGALAWLVLVLPSLSKLSERRLLLDVWGPIAVIGPLLFLTGRVDSYVAETAGRLAFGGSALMAAPAVGLVFLRAPGRFGGESIDNIAPRGFACAMWICAGLVALLLSAANVLSALVGQCVFAAAAVILWISTPVADSDYASRRHAATRRADSRAALGMLIVIVLGISHGIALLGATSAAGEITTRAGGGVAMAYGMIILVATGLCGPPSLGFRLAGWAAALGVLFALGVQSLLHMLPFVEAMLRGNESFLSGVFGNGIPRNVAYGFSALAPEATLLLAVGISSVVVDRIGTAARRTMGAILAGAATCLLLWRLL